MLETPSEPPRARRYQKNVRRILDAATEAIVAGGLESLSMNRLAATLDYTPGALYRYFASKDALVAALLVEIVDEIGADVARAVAAFPEASALAHVVACTEAWRAFAARDPHRFALLAMLLAAPRRVVEGEVHTAPAMTAMLGAMGPLVAALARAVDRAELAAPPAGQATDRAMLLFAGLLGVLLLRKQAERAPALIDLERLYRAMSSSLLTGWGASPAALEHAFVAAKESVTP